MTANVALIDRICFCGHTHVPGVFVEPPATGGSWQFYVPRNIDHHWRFTNRKTHCERRGGGATARWRRCACYATVEGSADLRFHRVEYDVEATIAKIRDVPELSPALAERLREGHYVWAGLPA